LTRDEALALQRKDDSNARPPLLSEVVALAEQYASELQLDLKDWRPLSPERVRALVALTGPLGEGAIVSSGQDWNLRAIVGYTNTLRLGFDPDHLAAESRRVPVPARLGAYAYRDDHPLAIGRSQSVDEYLPQRIDDLLSKCPTASEFFVEFRLLLQAADEGVSLPELLHDRGVAVSAWTLDYEGGKSIATLKKLSSIGVDCVTTNTSQQFVEALTA
jgi:glycerophosphoryl diester phosphodiesterase